MQIRLPGSTADALVEIGQRVRDLFAADTADPHRITGTVDDAYLRELATALAGRLGGRTGLAPRL